MPSKKENRNCPYDYYYDNETKLFAARIDYKGQDEFYYDDTDGVYKVDEVPDSSQVKEHKDKKKLQRDTKKQKGIERRSTADFFFDELQGKWVLKTEAPKGILAEIAWDENGQRFCYKYEGDWRGLTGLSPDDFFFDEKSGKFYQKPARQSENFKYHPTDGVWKMIGAEKKGLHKTRPKGM